MTLFYSLFSLFSQPLLLLLTTFYNFIINKIKTKQVETVPIEFFFSLSDV